MKPNLKELNEAIQKYYWELHDDYEDAKISQDAWFTFDAFQKWLGEKLEAFEKQLNHTLKELEKTDSTDGTYNPYNITYPYSQFWQKKIKEILGVEEK